MISTHVDIERAEWTSGTPFYGPAAVYEGNEIVQLKILSDRRQEGGGIAWLAKFTPPPGKLIKIVATALSDEHVFNLEGGRGIPASRTRSGRWRWSKRAPASGRAEARHAVGRVEPDPDKVAEQFCEGLPIRQGQRRGQQRGDVRSQVIRVTGAE